MYTVLLLLFVVVIVVAASLVAFEIKTAGLTSCLFVFFERGMMISVDIDCAGFSCVCGHHFRNGAAAYAPTWKTHFGHAHLGHSML